MKTSLGESREALLRRIPAGGVWAEIGVARGDFSERILEVARPSRLHLIDPWRRVLRMPGPPLDPNNLSDDQMERRYLALCERMRPRSQVAVHRMTSAGAAGTFPDEYFSAIYIDGDHRYESVLADLRAYARTMKRTGLILGHDYTESAAALTLRIGVVEAVRTFVDTSAWRLVAVTRETFPTFVLAQDDDAAEAFLAC